MMNRGDNVLGDKKPIHILKIRKKQIISTFACTSYCTYYYLFTILDKKTFFVIFPKNLFITYKIQGKCL